MASVIEHFEALQLPHEERNDRAPELSFARSMWNSLAADLFSSEATVSAHALDEASGHSGVLHFINQCVQLSDYVDGFHSKIQR